MINWNEPKFGEREKELVCEVLDSGYVSEGPMTEELEKRLAEVVNCKHVIMTTSCTAALHLALEADKLIRGYLIGEVIIPSLTFVATKNAVEMAGLFPRIVNSNRGFFIDNSRAIIQVNILGRSASDIYDFQYLCDEFNQDCTVICDNAGALGSNVSNGKVGCYSLQGNKIISCGQGGFCATNDDEYAKIIRQLKDFGRKDKYDNRSTGFNYKFNDILAAVALGQLEELPRRKSLLLYQYAMYRHKLEKYGNFRNFTQDEIPLWIEFTSLYTDELFDYLKLMGINCRKPWNPLIDDDHQVNDYYKNTIWLPNGPTLTPEKQKEVIMEIRHFYETY